MRSEEFGRRSKMKIKKQIIIAAFMVLAAAGGEAWGQATVHLSADTIALGDQTTLTIANAEAYPSTDMLGQGDIIAIRQDFDTATHAQHTVLTCFEPGEKWIHYGPDDSIPLVVTDVEVDTTTAEIRDIAAIEKVPYTFWEIFLWVLLAIAAIALGVGGWWLWRRMKNTVVDRDGMVKPVDPRNPEERALDTLEALRLKKLWQMGRVKEYHTELTDTVRLFIEEATGIHATEMTSDDTLDEVEHWNRGLDLHGLRELLRTADLVKFAKNEPMPHEHDRSMAQAVEFVKQLWQIAKPQETAEQKQEEASHE